ncbi:efflux RND transporter periplasmic adaptor subunit [Piscinibacter sakaiensis]|uniref:efflux RND transporter periplasmic adaptor subunit n=1 Tax=Piscinibacter sakaiensis TaxID=1547922 RepID=UPI003AAB8C9F
MYQPVNPTLAPHRRRYARWLPAIALLAASGLPAPAAAQPDRAASAAATAAASVDVARLDTVWLQPEREAPAVVVARNEAKLAAEASGVLLRWTADVGAQVDKGDLLAQIDPRDAELALQRARAALQAASARLELAQAQLSRARELVAQGFFSQEALAQRETEVALLRSERSSQQAQLALAQRQLDKTSLRAPFAGTIRQRLAQTGETVAPGSVLFVLTETGAAEVEATLSPADAAGLRRAEEPRFESPAGSFALQLLRISPLLSAPARTRTARLVFRDADGAPAPGSSGSLRWIERQPHLPPDLLVRRAGQLGVYVEERSGGITVARFVALPGAQEGRASAVPDTLGPTTRIVVRGQAGLRDGQPISSQPR